MEQGAGGEQYAPPSLGNKQWLRPDGLGHCLLEVSEMPTTQTLDKGSQQERHERARRWQQLRKDYLLTQAKLADELGISRRTVQYVEAGQMTPTLTTRRVFRDFARRCRYEFNGGGEAA